MDRSFKMDGGRNLKGLWAKVQDLSPNASSMNTQEAAVMKIPIPMANLVFFFQKVANDTLKMIPN